MIMMYMSFITSIIELERNHNLRKNGEKIVAAIGAGQLLLGRDGHDIHVWRAHPQANHELIIVSTCAVLEDTCLYSSVFFRGAIFSYGIFLGRRGNPRPHFRLDS